MKLLDYLKLKGLTLAAFADQVGASYATVQYWATDVKLPRKPMMRKIFEATDGLVTANDFHDLPDTKKENAA